MEFVEKIWCQDKPTGPSLILTVFLSFQSQSGLGMIAHLRWDIAGFRFSRTVIVHFGRDLTVDKLIPRQVTQGLQVHHTRPSRPRIDLQTAIAVGRREAGRQSGLSPTGCHQLMPETPVSHRRPSAPGSSQTASGPVGGHENSHRSSESASEPLPGVPLGTRDTRHQPQTKWHPNGHSGN